MNKKEAIDFITSLALMILACLVLLLPTFKINDLKFILTIIYGFYTLFKLTEFILIFKSKDYESLFTSRISLGALLSIYQIELLNKNIVLIFLIWLGLMSLVKLKKADFYHDRANKMWILRIIMLFIFIASGLITSLNLFYESEVQILIIGYFFFINSILDLIDPIVLYLKRGNK